MVIIEMGKQGDHVSEVGVRWGVRGVSEGGERGGGGGGRSSHFMYINNRRNIQIFL